MSTKQTDSPPQAPTELPSAKYVVEIYKYVVAQIGAEHEHFLEVFHAALNAESGGVFNES